MKTRRIIALALCLIMALTALAACSGKKETLIMATNAKFQPFEFVTSEEKGLFKTYDGIDVAIGMEIAKELDSEFDIKDMDFDSILLAISNGEADMGIAAITITDERKLSVDFSDPYCIAYQAIIVNKDNTTINGVADLVGKKIGVVLGYTGDEAMTGYEGVNDSDIKRYKSGVDAILELTSGTIDAVVIDSPTASAFIAKNPGLKSIDDPYFAKEEYGIAVKKGNTELLEKINKVIKDMKDSGTMDKLAEEVEQRLS